MCPVGEFLAGKSASVAMSVGAKRLMERLRSDEKRMDEVRREIYEDIALETHQALIRLEAKYGHLIEEVAEKLSERELIVLIAQLREQAAKSAVQSRLKLLCGAIAGIFTPDMALEDKSRYTRAIVALEASDVLMLKRIAIKPQNYEHLRDENWAGWYAIMINGCTEIDNQPGEPMKLKATAFGHGLLRFVESWDGSEAQG